MDVILSLLQNVLEEGLIYGIVAMGVYITYKILDFPDLTVDGSFPFGAAITVRLINGFGVPAILTLPIAFLGGALPALPLLWPAHWLAALRGCSMCGCALPICFRALL